MGLDKAIKYNKEWRKPYRGAKAVDCSCRNHGTCEWCKGARMYRTNREVERMDDMEREWKVEGCTKEYTKECTERDLTNYSNDNLLFIASELGYEIKENMNFGGKVLFTPYPENCPISTWADDGGEGDELYKKSVYNYLLTKYNKTKEEE